MVSTLSLVTSIKDYVEVVHKLIETDSNSTIQTYNDLGAVISYFVLTGKSFFVNFLSFRWLQQLPTLTIFVPDIASAMISEISVLDGYFHNALTLVPISYGNQNLVFYSLEKFSIGFINSLVVFLPTSTASLITFRRFVVQGVEAGYLSGLGTLLGSLIWIASILFGWRFLVLPWLSLDILRYSIGLILLVKYMWDSYTERRMVLEDLSKWKIFLLTFLLAFTEQTSLFPFLRNISLGSDASILETFPSDSTHISSFFIVHGSYLFGLAIGGFSILQLTCWFWENPAFRLYTWALSKVKNQTRFNLKFLNFLFLYLTMVSAMSNVVYFGLDYTLTKPFGLVPNDRLIDQKMILETSFLGTKASDRNTRMNMGRRGRRERWKKSVQRYRNFDASLYGEGIYDLFTMEDLNYGFDRFWLRKKMRNHDVPFRLFPGPWVRSFKKQLSRPRLESFSGPRFEFFRILFEQVYHPIFHEKKPEISPDLTIISIRKENEMLNNSKVTNQLLTSLEGKEKAYEVNHYNNDGESWSPSQPQPRGIIKTVQPVVTNLATLPLSPSPSPTGKGKGKGTTFGSLLALRSKQKQGVSFPEATLVGEERELQKRGLEYEFSVLQKFVRKAQTRIQTSKIAFELKNSFRVISNPFKKIENTSNFEKEVLTPVYSKRWKMFFSKWKHRRTSFKETNDRLKNSLLSAAFGRTKVPLKVYKFTKKNTQKAHPLSLPNTKSVRESSKQTPTTNREGETNLLDREKHFTNANISSGELNVSTFVSIPYPRYIEEKKQKSISITQNKFVPQKKEFETLLSKKDRQILKYQSFISGALAFPNTEGVREEINPNTFSVREEASPLEKKDQTQGHLTGLLIMEHGEKKISSYPNNTNNPNNPNNPNNYSTASFTDSFAVHKNTLKETPKTFVHLDNYKPMTLFHPIRFYLHKEKAFKRKLKFYGATLFRNFGVSNNSPYFRIMMKKFFYYYKPTLRWERTMRVATLKKIRRKGPRQPLRLSSWLPEDKMNSYPFLKSDENINTKSSVGLLMHSHFATHSLTGKEKQPKGKTALQDDLLSIKESDKKTNNYNRNSLTFGSKTNKLAYQNFDGLQKPTHMYSLIGKRASRYRYQIYKDVLQHWYYSPFNRLLLKLDIDAFIRRQPSGHFLTANEEHLLQLRRMLLLDHYETLRWYTYMQHYRSMKAQIGGTKSFASRFYNQQFQGTFKKIRHLFSVTPVLGQDQSLINNNNSGRDANILKWDQSLYHEYPNNAQFSILNDSLLHEELLTEDKQEDSQKKTSDENNDVQASDVGGISYNAYKVIGLEKSRTGPSETLVEESQKIVGTYLIHARPIRQKLISQYLQEKRYWELTRFLFKGQKLRGTVPITNSSAFLNQEKDYLYTNIELKNLRQQTRKELKNTILEGKIKQNLWMSFIKKNQMTVYDRKSFKNYLKNKVEIEETQKKLRQKQLKDRFDRIQNWLVMESNVASNNPYLRREDLAMITKNNINYGTDNQKKLTQTLNVVQNLSTGVQKAIKEGIQMQENLSGGIFNTGQSVPPHNQTLMKFKRPLWRDPIVKAGIQHQINTYFQKHTFNSKNKILKQNLKNSLLNIEDLIEKNQEVSALTFFNVRCLLHNASTINHNFFGTKILSLMKRDFKNKNRLTTSTSRFKLHKTFRKIKLFLINVFKNQPKHIKDLKSWKAKQHVLVKRKQTRKVLKQLKKQVNRVNSGFNDITQDFKMVDSNLNNVITRQKQDSSQDNTNVTVPFPFPIGEGEGEGKVGSNFLLRSSLSASYLLPFPVGAKEKQGLAFASAPKSTKPWNLLNFTKDFQTRRSRKRGKKPNRTKGGVIKKPTLNDKLKRQFKILKRSGKKLDNRKIEMFKEESSSLTSQNDFQLAPTKARRTRQRENRFWRRHKKAKYNQNRRQMKKRKRFSIGKIRNIKKEIKRIQSQAQIRKWWWQTYLPEFRSNIDRFFQISKEQKIEEKLQSLSSSEIMNRDVIRDNSSRKKTKDYYFLQNSLQIGDYDYKPLNLPQTLWIRDQFKKSLPLEITVSQIQEGIINNKHNGQDSFQQNQQPNLSHHFNHNWNETNLVASSSSYVQRNQDVKKEVTTLPSKGTKSVGENIDVVLFLTPKVLGKQPLISKNVIESLSTNLLTSNMIYLPSEISPDVEQKVARKTPLLLSQGFQPNSDIDNLVDNINYGNSYGGVTEQKIVPKKLMKSFNPMPFYAGWDESLRKFVVTNRLLSRRDAGYKIFPSLTEVLPGEIGYDSSSKKNRISQPFLKKSEVEKRQIDSLFSLYPLKGINVATTLYWQVPFTTYDPDQFFALGRDGFAPIGWRRFSFPATKQTIQPILVQTKTVTSYLNNVDHNYDRTSAVGSKKLVETLQQKLLKRKSNINYGLDSSSLILAYKNNDDSDPQKQEDFIQFSQKRNKRIKSHPRSPVSFPSGPLIHQILPVHYIYIFYKRDRLPRDRYISRRLRRVKEGPSFAMQESLLKSTDWTLRKRVKPRRRYHRTRRDSSVQLGQNNIIVLRRQFLSSSPNYGALASKTRQRPMSKPKLTTGQQFEDRLKERYKQRTRNSTLKLKGENLRIRQLRRRVQRQVIRPVWRYQPHPGGFVWPGDYLRLESIKAPRLISSEILHTSNIENTQNQMQGLTDLANDQINREIRRKASKKKKRNIQSWQIQPKKYLIQKHNRKVLKKRLQKAQNQHKFNEP